MVVHQHHRRVAASAHALAFQQGEFAVSSSFAEADAEFLFQVIGCIHAAAQGARQIGADGEFVFAHRMQVVHIVEGGHFISRCGRNADIIGYVFDGFGA